MFGISNTTLLVLALWSIPGLVGFFVSGSKKRSRIIWTVLCIAVPPFMVLILNLPPLEPLSQGDIPPSEA